MLIGLTGVARSGKDTIGRILVENYGFARRALADPVRRGLLALDPVLDVGNDDPWRLSDELDYWLGDWEKLKDSLSYGTEVRELLQRFGTEAGRDLHGPDVWVNALFREPVPRHTVITDVRFLNEAEAVRSRGGFVVRVIRPGVGPVNEHASETEISSIPTYWRISNHGSLNDLEENVSDMVKALRRSGMPGEWPSA